MKDIDEAKKSLLKSIPDAESEAFRNLLNGLDVYERLALLEFLVKPTDFSYAVYVTRRLDAEQQRLISEGVPSSQWPSQLQNPNWDIEVVSSLMPGVGYGEISPGCKDFLEPESSKRIRSLYKLRIPKSPPSPVIQINEKPQDEPQAIKENPGKGEPPQPKANVKNEGDPFRSDSFGSIQGEEDRSQYGLGNRRVR